MESISSWYANKARRPLLLLVFLILILQFSYLAFAIYANERRYSDLVENVLRITNIALMQKNRIVLETLTYTISENTDFAEFYICQGSVAIVAFPAQKNGCLGLQGGLLQKVEETVVPGFADFKIVSKVSRVKVPLGYLIVVISTVLISIVGIVLIKLVSRRFEREILFPIVSDFDGTSSGKIHEFRVLKERRSQLVELEKGKAVADIARQVAHDIRSPMSALHIFVQKNRSLLGEDVGLLMAITERVIGIADSLLERSRVLDTKSTSLQSLIEEASKVVAEKLLRFPQAKITNTYNINELERYFANIDRLEWGRLVSNLIENSVEAAFLYPVEIELNFELVNSHFKFSCVDNGRGLELDDIKKLKNVGGTIGKSKGNGIGLAHLKKVVAEGNGFWTLSSEIGRGTRIEISFPVELTRA